MIRSAWLVVMLGAAALSGCAPPPPSYYAIPSSPALHDAAFALQAGDGSIEGVAAMTRADGAFASCRGEYATLVPDVRATRARLQRIYGSGRVVSFASAPRLPPDPRFNAYVRRADCDAAGRFRFDGMAAGSYFVVAPLRARGEGIRQGVSVRTRVTMRAHEIKRVRLTP